ncbi:SAM-dependent methyltransferase [Streptomyces hawaiiensis]|uniref:SAM-dependent methyltransferase n=1 Tax=Streptomyces hawaiiensis TaxID=67305 RepID=UPI0036507A9E
MSGGIDVTTPSTARMHNALLGGVDNYTADREACEALLTVLPAADHLARQSRTFLERAVTDLALAGITQFIDLGCGLPAHPNTHEITAMYAPGACTAYVDMDPVVLAHARAILDENDQVLIVDADLRDTAWLGDERLRHHLDWTQPIAVLLVAVLECLPDEAAAALVACVAERLPAGSAVVVASVVSTDPVRRATAMALMRMSVPGWTLRGPADLSCVLAPVGADITPPDPQQSTYLATAITEPLLSVCADTGSGTAAAALASPVGGGRVPVHEVLNVHADRVGDADQGVQQRRGVPLLDAAVRGDVDA